MSALNPSVRLLTIITALDIPVHPTLSFQRIYFSMQRFLVVIRVILGFIFILSGISKFADLHSFANSIKNIGFTSDSFIPILSISIPVIESLAGVSLLLGLWVRASSSVVIGLLIIFIAAIVPNIANGNEIDCGCFGPLSQDKVGTSLLIRDVVMLGFALVMYTQGSHKNSHDHFITRERN